LIYTSRAGGGSKFLFLFSGFPGFARLVLYPELAIAALRAYASTLSIALEYVCRVTRGFLYIFSVLNSFTYTKEFHLRWTLGLKGRPTARPVHQDSITQGIDN
jgi:hypothetical protein